MNIAAKRLMNFLEEGEENAKKGLDIEIEVGLGRNEIRRYLLEEDLPIGSSPKGYFIISNEEEFNKVILQLNKRIEGLEKRKCAIEKGWKKGNPAEILKTL